MQTVQKNNLSQSLASLKADLKLIQLAKDKSEKNSSPKK